LTFLPPTARPARHAPGPAAGQPAVRRPRRDGPGPGAGAARPAAARRPAPYLTWPAPDAHPPAFAQPRDSFRGPRVPEGTGPARRLPHPCTARDSDHQMIVHNRHRTPAAAPGGRHRHGQPAPRAARRARTLSAICPCTTGNSRSPGTQRNLTGPGTNSPQARKTPGHAPFPQVVAGVGFEPA
jgi:hypothetical protein